MKSATPSKTVKTIKIVANILVWAFVAFSMLVTISVFASLNDVDGVPALGGYCSINIITDSMNPTFKKGDMIVGKKLSTEEKTQLEVGDIISYHVDLNGDGNKEINTHRIIEVNKKSTGEIYSYITKGDNKETNVVADKEPVLAVDVISVYTNVRFPGIGNVISFLQTSIGFLVVIVLPLVAFFIYELIKFIMTVVAVKNEGKKQITAADEELIKQRAIEEYLRQQREAEAKKNDEDP